MRVLRPILRRLLLHPNRVVITDDQRCWKGFHLYIGALHLAAAIEKASDRDKVGIILPTSGLFPMAMIASWMLGRTIVPINYLLKHDDLAYVVDDAELDLVVTVTPMLDIVEGLPEHLTLLKLDELKSQFKGLPKLRKSKRRPDDALAALLYTSGTSGRPKGVMLSSGNLAENVQQVQEFIHFTPAHRFLGVLPQFHSFGLTALTLIPLSVGSPIIYTARFMPKRILKLLSTHRPNVLIAIPSMFNALLHAKSATSEHFESLEFVVSGGEPLPEAVFTGYRDTFKVIINEGYGLTETSPVSHWCRPQDHRHGSVGRPIPKLEHRIIDVETGSVLGPGQDGEIIMRGPNIMQGYYKLPEDTAKVIDDDGFFHTGDMGRIDEDDFLYITGRIKEMLIIGGENVFPREIEEVLNDHPSVKDSAVIGIQDDSRGEVALAFIELAEDCEFDETGIRSHCREQLAQYKVPRDVRVVEALPRNPTGKILRRELSAETPSMV
ncbi:MAG: AMP-binding protein [Planctomycetota bacterium]